MNSIKIDLHRYNKEEAYDYLLDKIDEAYDKGIYLIEVIHGYNRGDTLKQMVLSLTSDDHSCINRIRSKLGNSGTTYIELKIPVE